MLANKKNATQAEKEKKQSNAELMREILGAASHHPPSITSSTEVAGLERMSGRSDAPTAIRLNNILRKLNICAEIPESNHGTQHVGNCLFEAFSQSFVEEQFAGVERLDKYKDSISGPIALREDLYRWVMEESVPIVKVMKRNYEQFNAIGGQHETWENFWCRMRIDQIWAEDIVTNALAYFLEVDVLQISDHSTEAHPWQLFSGNREDLEARLECPPVMIGYLTRLHYVSLRPSLGVPEELRLEEYERMAMIDSLRKVVQVATQDLAEDLVLSGSVSYNQSFKSQHYCLVALITNTAQNEDNLSQMNRQSPSFNVEDPLDVTCDFNIIIEGQNILKSLTNI